MHGVGAFPRRHLCAGDELYAAEGVPPAEAYRQIVENQNFGGDVESFALSLAAIRLFLLGDEAIEARPHLYVHDMLLHSPERQGELFTEAERVTGLDQAVDALGPVDLIEFDAVVGNPPYGARKPEWKRRVYARLYEPPPADLRAGSAGPATRTRTRCSSPTASSDSAREAACV